ncbi:[protein-PII] uridylyltransferase [Aestuariirhabdus litorea]|uniref:Bifunctional uridylyltransferase/uridylyl-removing enzyme n=1 Tax=Aestuariirhabdus litorea TaxID=2528527 RepID=A0A3P3VQP4_9GAMM|nr:[protein-PII] uridylyltransferase [Aestuariirhabdus litorea]RRJ85112.1 [protein-PII] uridylyltransferase [Aestuariirhabdus litorea]RWW98337.1 [protein-PII] uridylyltransferase [Endozoicomonadaceae bacterium GTF-13]
MQTIIDEQQLTDELFNKGQFRAELTLSSSPIPAYKRCIRQAQETLDRWYREGRDIRMLVNARAWMIDQVLSLAWNHLDWGKPGDVALLAVGGYGRGELHPSSDIDLLILLRTENHGRYRDNIERFLTLLWDINLEVGQSVRSVKECAVEASKDLTVITNLLESRTLAGPETLREAMLKRIDPRHMWPSKIFLREKYEEQRARHRKFNETEYNLEPNVKNSPGGLRDTQMILWVTRRHFGAESAHDLVRLEFLTESEYQILQEGQAFLWRVRWGLHMLTGREEDRLLFDHQKHLAELFGYSDSNKSLAVEQFMQRYYQVVLGLAELNDMLLQHLDEVILSVDDDDNVIPLNSRFQVRKNYIEVMDPNVFVQSPFALLELFVLMTQNPFILGVRASTIRLIREHRYLIDDEFRHDIRNTTLFIELMRAPYGLTVNLRRMLRWGVLGLYLPEFGKITGQMQHDLFHAYTVDAHTLLLIKFLRSFTYEENAERFPVASKVIRKLPKPELIYIAGLYHDIAKGRGGDHSELGAVDAEAFCERHHLSKWDSALVAWLVKTHLLMSTTAQRQDLSDPDVINDFAKLVGDQVRLDYLYLLTVADINATNASLWNSWRAALLRRLYSETKRALRRGLENPLEAQQAIAETQSNARSELEGVLDSATIDGIWSTLSEEYFLRHSVRDVVWHTLNIARHHSNDPLVLVRETTDRAFEGGTKIFIYTCDLDELFAASTAVIDQLNLDIQDARIITSNAGYSFDTFIVLELDGSPIGNNPQRIKEIKRVLTEALKNPEDYPLVIRRRTPRQLKHFSYPAEVTISNDPLIHRTVLEVVAPDRPGLLALMGQVFMDLDISIHNAKIATLGERVEDVFIITDAQQRPIEDPKQCQQICDTLREALDAHTQENASRNRTTTSTPH